MKYEKLKEPKSLGRQKKGQGGETEAGHRSEDPSWGNAERHMSHTVYEDWMVGVLGILGMAFFIGCTSCWQYFTDKSADPAARRQPPPPPTPGAEPRYELGLYPPNPPQDATTQHSAPNSPREKDKDSEEDFEEIQNLHTAQQSDVTGQNPAPSHRSTEEIGAHQGSYVNLEEAQDYVNISGAAPDVPVLKELPIYVEIVNSQTDRTTADKEEEEGKTPRSAVNSIGKYSSHSDSLCHSYENVAVGSPPNRSESDLDYVNMTTTPAL